MGLFDNFGDCTIFVGTCPIDGGEDEYLPGEEEILPGGEEPVSDDFEIHFPLPTSNAEGGSDGASS